MPRALIGAALARLNARVQRESLPECCRAAAESHDCCASRGAGLRLPVVSALACKGVAGWLVPFAAAPAVPIGEFAWSAGVATAAWRPAGTELPPAIELAPDPPPPRV